MILDVPVEVAIESVDVNLDRLTAVSSPFSCVSLKFAVIQMSSRGTRSPAALAGLYAMPEFHRLAADDAAHRSVDFRIAEVQPAPCGLQRQLAVDDRWLIAISPSHRQLVAAPSEPLRSGLALSNQAVRLCDFLLARLDSAARSASTACAVDTASVSRAS